MDERLREKEFGILDRLTHFGIRQKYPELGEQRAHVGKFYFRPPGGESWCDVILRLRSLLEMVTREHGAQRVLVVGHQVIVNCMRYLIECMDEAQILGIDKMGDVPNCGVTSYEYDPARDALVPDLVNFVAPLRQAGAAGDRGSRRPGCAQALMPCRPSAHGSTWTPACCAHGHFLRSRRTPTRRCEAVCS